MKRVEEKREVLRVWRSWGGKTGDKNIDGLKFYRYLTDDHSDLLGCVDGYVAYSVIPEPGLPQIFDLVGKPRYPESRAIGVGAGFIWIPDR